MQTAVYVDMLSTVLHSRGPFLIVAPLCTISHWQREFTRWTDFNTIVYHGSEKERELIRKLEFAFESDRPEEIGRNQRYLKKCHCKTAPQWMRTWMIQVVVTTPKLLLTKDFSELADVQWDLLVVDEQVHRLKSHLSKLSLNLRDDKFQFNHTLLLTGTPLEEEVNTMSELWTLMNIIDPKTFDDCDRFMDEYGTMMSKENLDDVISPYTLRRVYCQRKRRKRSFSTLEGKSIATQTGEQSPWEKNDGEMNKTSHEILQEERDSTLNEGQFSKKTGPNRGRKENNVNEIAKPSNETHLSQAEEQSSEKKSSHNEHHFSVKSKRAKWNRPRKLCFFEALVQDWSWDAIQSEFSEFSEEQLQRRKERLRFKVDLKKQAMKVMNKKRLHAEEQSSEKKSKT